MGTKSLLRIILSIAVIVGYFLPWLQGTVAASAFDVVRASTEYGYEGQYVWYATILIPLFALICLILSATNKVPGAFTRAIPFLVTAIVVGLLFLGSTDDASVIGPEELVSMLGMGLYVTIGASFLLMFIGRDTVTVPVNPAI